MSVSEARTGDAVAGEIACLGCFTQSKGAEWSRGRARLRFLVASGPRDWRRPGAKLNSRVRRLVGQTSAVSWRGGCEPHRRAIHAQWTKSNARRAQLTALDRPVLRLTSCQGALSATGVGAHRAPKAWRLTLLLFGECEARASCVAALAAPCFVFRCWPARARSVR